MGIDEITPLICQRSERKIVKTDRLIKVISSAMKQSLKAYHPQLNEAMSFTDMVTKDVSAKKFIAYVEEGEHQPLKSCYLPGDNAIVLIGPEGDFSPDEITIARQNGFQVVSLGKSRLRTETAGIVAVTTIAVANNE